MKCRPKPFLHTKFQTNQTIYFVKVDSGSGRGRGRPRRHVIRVRVRGMFICAVLTFFCVLLTVRCALLTFFLRPPYIFALSLQLRPPYLCAHLTLPRINVEWPVFNPMMLLSCSRLFLFILF